MMRKTLMFIAAVISAAFALSSCEPAISGEFTYAIRPAEDTSFGQSTAWHAAPFGESYVRQEMSKIGKKVRAEWTVSGYKNECDMLVKTAIDNAISRAEADPNYNKFFNLGGVTIVVYCGSDQNGESGPNDLTTDFEIYKRTYSK